MNLLSIVLMSLCCHQDKFLYTHCARRLNAFSLRPIFFIPSFLLQPFRLPHAASSPASTKPRSCWSGASLVTWAAAMMSSTTSFVRSASPTGECVRAATTTWTSHRATWDWPSGVWRSGTCKPTHSTASRSRRSTAFPTRAPIRPSSPPWTSPQIRPVGAASALWLPGKDQHWCFRRCQLSKAGKRHKRMSENTLCA